MRSRKLRGLRVVGVAAALVLPLLAVFPMQAANASVTGAVNTTDDPNWNGPDPVNFPGVDANGNTILGAPTQACLNAGSHTSPAVNCNQYNAKTDVFLSGTPNPAALGEGTYFFAVLVPGGQPDANDGSLKNLSSPDDSATNREFSSDGTGTITPLNSTHAYDAVNNVLQVAPFEDTTNNGGVYILATCKISDKSNDFQDPVPPVSGQDCKYDAFKAPSINTAPGPQALTVIKNATPTFTREFNWSVAKTVDGKSSVSYNITGTSKDLAYEVVYTKTLLGDSGWEVKGTITVTNPNASNVTGDINDKVLESDMSTTDPNAGCTVNGGTNTGLTFPPGNSDWSLDCTYTSAGPAQWTQGMTTKLTEYNKVTVSWADQDIAGTSSCPDSAVPSCLAAGSASFTVDFTWNNGTTGNPTVIHDCVNVSDNNPGNVTAGTAPAGEKICKSTTYDYTVTVTVPHGCVENDNTARFDVVTTDADADDSGTASTTAKVCRVPVTTGALTMGFWQNKNGQAIISKANQANLGNYLRQFHPFSDACGSGTCASYVYNIIKAATCSGPTSSPCNKMLRAQVLASALNVYFSAPTSDTTDCGAVACGGNKINAPGAIGAVKIDLTQICHMIDGSGGTATCSGTYEDVRAEFGGATCLSVLNMLLYQNTADPAADAGAVWYGNVKATQVLAKDAFDATNNQVAFGC